MATRLVLGYALLVLLIAGISGLIAWKQFHSHERSYRRRLERERKA